MKSTPWIRIHQYLYTDCNQLDEWFSLEKMKHEWNEVRSEIGLMYEGIQGENKLHRMILWW